MAAIEARVATTTDATVGPDVKNGTNGGPGWRLLSERIEEWHADGRLERLLAFLEGVFGVSDAVSEPMVASAGETAVSALALLEPLADTKSREGVAHLLRRLGEWHEAGTLDSLAKLAEGAVGFADAATESMVAEAAESLVAGARFVQGLPPWDEVEPVVAAFRARAQALQALLALVRDLESPRALRREMAGTPHVSGLLSLGRALRDPETQRGLSVALVLLRRLGRLASDTPRP